MDKSNLPFFNIAVQLACLTPLKIHIFSRRATKVMPFVVYQCTKSVLTLVSMGYSAFPLMEIGLLC